TDENSCGATDDLPEDNGSIESCDYCTPTLTNVSFGWINISCLADDTMNQTRDLTQYDVNYCGEIDNETFVEYRNTEYCDYIISTEFRGNSTDLSAVDLSNITNLVLETDYGKISFSETISINRSIDLNSNIRIENNSIFINTTALPELNKSAVLTLYNLAFVNPIILKDGNELPSSVCIRISYENGTLVFNVTLFSAYSVAEGAYCGDCVCNNGESCSTCSADCGACPSSGGGGSGGSGGGGRRTEDEEDEEETEEVKE
ncbi:unnamed protein product, partial [marine sediment metagenome]